MPSYPSSIRELSADSHAVGSVLGSILFMGANTSAARSSPLDEIAEALRSHAFDHVPFDTATRSERIRPEKRIDYERDGCNHVFRRTDPDEIADEKQRMLDDWYAKMDQLIGEFRVKYEQSKEQALDSEPDRHSFG